MNSESSTDQAAQWAARLDAGTLSKDEAAALTQWLDADPANEGRLEEMQRLHQQVRAVLPGMVAEGRLRVEKPKSRMSLGWAWAAASVMVLVVGLFVFMQRPAVFSTGAAQRKAVVLDDGTKVELNACTTLRVRMKKSQRWIMLEKGEALFAVMKDPSRPFFVETAAGRVRVTGTVFNVNSLNQNSLEVVLLEGSVEATQTANGAVRQLMPGDQWSVRSGKNEMRRLLPDDLADAMAWREGKTIFRNTPLDRALAEFARHHARAIEIAPAARDLMLGGRFDLDDLEGFLRDLAVALPVEIKHGSDGVIRVGRAAVEPDKK